MVLCINYDENFRKYFDLWDHFRPVAKKKRHNNTNSATERIDSAGSADGRGAVGQATTTGRMTDTTMRTRARDRAQPWLRMQPC